MNDAVKQLAGESNPAYKLYNAGFVQRREWILHKVREDRYPFNVSTSFEMGSFDPLLVQRIIDLVTERHEILRTTLKVIDGSLKQLIHPPETFPATYTWIDLFTSEGPQSISRYQAILADAIRKPFDFERGPLFRVLVIGLAPDHYWIHFIFHHVISDHHSLGLFDREVMEMYRVLTKGAQYRSWENAIQYRDYTRFENELLETPKGDKYRDYWLEVLKQGFPAFRICGSKRIAAYEAHYLHKVMAVKEKIGRLPGADNRFLSSVMRRYQEDDGGKLVFRYDNILFEKSIRFCEKGPHGWLCLLLAALMFALYELSNQVRFVFDIPGSGRASRQYDQTMGWLTSGGPCFFDLTGHASTHKLLSYIDQQLFALSRNCLYPYETVIEGDPSLPEYRMPAFLTLLYNKDKKVSAAAGILDHQPQGHTTYQDIAFFFTLYDNALVVDIIYNNSLFDAGMVESIVSRQATLLEDIVNGKGLVENVLVNEN